MREGGRGGRREGEGGEGGEGGGGRRTKEERVDGGGGGRRRGEEEGGGGGGGRGRRNVSLPHSCIDYPNLMPFMIASQICKHIQYTQKSNLSAGSLSHSVGCTCLDRSLLVHKSQHGAAPGGESWSVEKTASKQHDNFFFFFFFFFFSVITCMQNIYSKREYKTEHQVEQVKVRVSVCVVEILW